MFGQKFNEHYLKTHPLFEKKAGAHLARFQIFLCSRFFCGGGNKKFIVVGEGGLGLIPGRSHRTQCHQRLVSSAIFLLSCVVQELSRGDGPRHSLHPSTYNLLP